MQDILVCIFGKGYQDLFSASQRTTSQSLRKEGRAAHLHPHWHHHLINILLTASASCSSPMSWCSCSSSRNCFITFENSSHWAYFAEKSQQPVHKTRCCCPLCAPWQARVSQKVSKIWTSNSSKRKLFTASPSPEVLLVVSKEVFKFKLL